MVKKILGSLLVVSILVFSCSSAFAVIKGIESSKSSLVKVGESVTVPEGADIRSAVAVGGSVTVYGSVAEDVVAVGGSVYLKDKATVGGDVVSVGGKVVKEAGAVTKGDVVEIAMEGVSPTVAFFTKGGLAKGMFILSLITLIGFLALTAILVALFTPQLGKVSSALEDRLLKNFWIGLIIALLFFPVIVILVLSIVGIVLIPVWAIAVAAAAIFGYVAAAHLIGKRALITFKMPGKSMMTETLVGVLLLWLVGLVPFVGGLVKSIAVICGLGGIYLTRFGTE
jgi:hypothetical protein